MMLKDEDPGYRRDLRFSHVVKPMGPGQGPGQGPGHRPGP